MITDICILLCGGYDEKNFLYHVAIPDGPSLEQL